MDGLSSQCNVQTATPYEVPPTDQPTLPRSPANFLRDTIAEKERFPATLSRKKARWYDG